MKKFTKLPALFCILLFLTLFGCGQDNSISSGPTSPANNITGTYKLSSASGTYVYSGGTISFDTATSISGTLILGNGTWNETYIVDGVTYSKNGTYNINYTNGTIEGTIGTVYTDGAGVYGFSIDGYNLNLFGSPNSKWTKLSDI